MKKHADECDAKHEGLPRQQSIAAFAQGVGLLGVNMFDISGDTDQWDLTDAVRKGLGLA